MPKNDSAWFLIQTKPSKERWVNDRLSESLPEVFLPLLRTRMPRWGRLRWSVGPLFPQYLFARFSLKADYAHVQYLPGVRGLVCAGRDPLIVQKDVIDELKQRAVNGVVCIEEKPFSNGEPLRVVEGPFRGFEAIFERYLSGAERVAILLNGLGAGGLRVLLPVSAVVRHS